MTEVLHMADTHVGYRQYNAPVRRADFLDAFEAVLRDAVERDVDAVVHAGDVFHDRRPGLADLLGTVDALGILADAGIPFLAIVGNHEDKREAQWLDLFERLGLATRLDAEGTVVGDVTFYGQDYVPRSRREDLDYEFAPPETEHAALVAHGQFAPLAPAVHGDAWDLSAVLEAATVDLDAALLGDEHEHVETEVDGTRATYAGSTERTSASERDDRGYNLVTFGDGVGVRRKGLSTRPFRFVDVTLHGGEGVDRVRERVREYDLEDAVVVITIEGEGEPVTPAAVEEFAAERGALVARVNDRREVADEEAELDVSFADPDEAVRERVRTLGLSTAALDVDETVRDLDLADANVREAVSDRVEAHLDDPAAFEPADDGTVAGVDEESRDGTGDGEDGEAGDDGSRAGESELPSDEEEATAEPEAEATGGPADQPDDGEAEGIDNGDQQASMEEYL